MVTSYKTLDTVSRENFLGNFSNSVTTTYFDILLKMISLSKTLDKTLLVHAGFAVDLAIGHITREHKDLDLVTMVSDIPIFKELFQKAHFEVGSHPNTDPVLSFYARTFIQDIEKTIDIDVVSLDIDNDEVFDRRVVDGEKFIFPIKASEFVWERKIADVPIQFFSPYLVHTFKKIQQKHSVVREIDVKDCDILEKFYTEIKVL